MQLLVIIFENFVKVYELHRLYGIQKMLMKDICKKGLLDQHYNKSESGGNCRVNSTIEYENGDLELTLGPRSYYQKKMSENPGSWSSSGTFKDQKWGAEKPVSGQDRLNSPPWLLQALSLNMTT